MTGRVQVVIRDDPTVPYVVARGWRLGERLQEARVHGVFSGAVGGYMFDRGRLADLLAYLDSRNIAFRMDQPVLGTEGTPRAHGPA